MGNKVIEFKNVCFSYEEDISLIRGLSFFISEGETLGIIGRNGAGKSTILKILLGLLDYNEGEVWVDNLLLNKSNLKAIRNKVAYLFQDSDLQLFMPTVEEDVAFGLRNQGLGEAEVQKRVDESLEIVNALDLKERAPYLLSGGEKKKIALATILAMKPSILAFDEPTVGLDPKSRRTFINLVKKIEKTIIIATHDMDMAFELCDRILVLYNGSIVIEGEAKEVFKDEEQILKYDLEQPIILSRRHKE